MGPLHRRQGSSGPACGPLPTPRPSRAGRRGEVDTYPARDAAAERLRAVGAEFQAVRTTYEANRQRVVEAIIDALRADVPPSEVVALSGYTREGVRKIARAAGIQPA